MLVRLSFLSTLVVLAFAASASAQLPCANPAADPCLINAAATIPVGVYDIRPKSLVVANRLIDVSGAGELKILAANVTLQPGARFIAPGSGFNTATVTFDATGTIDMQSAGTSNSKIDVSNAFQGGTINLYSGGNITVDGTLIANGTGDLYAYGGEISLVSQTGDISLIGDSSGGLKAIGQTQGGGGSIFVAAIVGSVSVATQLLPKGADSFIDLEAGANITSTSAALVDMRAAGPGGEGGELDAIAGGDINLAGDILANGASGDLEGGDGGTLDIDAGGSITMSGRIELNGAGRYGLGENPIDGGGGSGDFVAGADITMNGPMFAISKGYGSGFDFDFDALGNVTFAAEIDLTGDVYGANLSVIADGLIAVSGRLHTATLADPILDPSVLGGGFDLEACQIDITPTGEVSATGQGGNPSGSNILTASAGLTIAGKLTATDVNELTYRSSAPVITGLVSPPPVIKQNDLLACCGVQCPVTTTTTSTTSSTSSSTTSSTSTSTSSTTVVVQTSSTTSAPPSTIGPTTSSTSLVPATTSTSLVPTTTSTLLEPTTTSTSSTTVTTSTSIPTTSTSTIATTTSSTSTLVPATTSTTVVATSSTVPPPSTTSTTSAPLTCRDKESGIGVVRCLLVEMDGVVQGASEDDLGGKRLAKVVVRLLGKAKTFSGEPTASKRLKKASKQLKILSAKLTKAVTKHKANADLVAQLTAHAGEAQNVLAGLVAP